MRNLSGTKTALFLAMLSFSQQSNASVFGNIKKAARAAKEAGEACIAASCKGPTKSLEKTDGLAQELIANRSKLTDELSRANRLKQAEKAKDIQKQIDKLDETMSPLMAERRKLNEMAERGSVKPETGDSSLSNLQEMARKEAQSITSKSEVQKQIDDLINDAKEMAKTSGSGKLAPDDSQAYQVTMRALRDRMAELEKQKPSR